MNAAAENSCTQNISLPFFASLLSVTFDNKIPIRLIVLSQFYFRIRFNEKNIIAALFIFFIFKFCSNIISDTVTLAITARKPN